MAEEKGLKFAGKDPDGNAKAVNISNKGGVIVQPSNTVDYETHLFENVENGQTVEFTLGVKRVYMDLSLSFNVNNLRSSDFKMRLTAFTMEGAGGSTDNQSLNIDSLPFFRSVAGNSRGWMIEESIGIVGETLRFQFTNNSGATIGAVRIWTGQNDVKREKRMEFYGATESDRPSAIDVPTGAVFMAVNSSDTWQSNGESWVTV